MFISNKVYLVNILIVIALTWEEYSNSKLPSPEIWSETTYVTRFLRLCTTLVRGPFSIN